jgi:hypothetical protein
LHGAIRLRPSDITDDAARYVENSPDSTSAKREEKISAAKVVELRIHQKIPPLNNSSSGLISFPLTEILGFFLSLLAFF